MTTLHTATSMDAAVLARPPRWLQRTAAVGRLALRAGVVLLVLLALACLLPAGRSALGLSTGNAAVGLLAAAALVYAVGHLLRGLRLAVLLHDPQVGARRVLAAHVLTSGLGLLLPFKLGDLARMGVVGQLVGSGTRGVVVVWLERTLDVAVVLGLSLLAATAADGELVTPLLVVSAGFVVLTVLAVTVLPDYLRALALYLVRRPAAPGGAGLVAFLARALVVLDEAPQLLRRRTPTLVVLTGLIWLAELAALRLSAPVLADDLLALSRALAGILSSLSSGSIALLPGTVEDAVAVGASELSGDDLARYRTVLLAPLLASSGIAGLLLLRGRWLPTRRRAASW